MSGRARDFMGRMGAWAAVAILMLGTGACGAQSSAVGLGGMPDNSNSPHYQPPAPPQAEQPRFTTDRVTEAQARMRRVYRAEQVQMVKDTNKLVELAAKLNAEVASQHGGALTPAELREVGKIEKLARSVRSKMEAPVPGGLFDIGPVNSIVFD